MSSQVQGAYGYYCSRVVDCTIKSGLIDCSLLGSICDYVSFSDSQFLDNLLYIQYTEMKHSLHIKFSPLLVVLAALSTLHVVRLLALVAGMLVLSAGTNNILQFNQAVAFINSHGSLCAIPSAKCAVDSKIISSP